MLRVYQTTDNRFVGLLLDVDPASPPEQIDLGGGVVFDPIEWVEVEAGKWKIRNPHYTVWAEEV